MSTELAQDIRWLREHAQELQDKYPDMYVAVYDGRVITADKDLKKCMIRLGRMARRSS